MACFAGLFSCGSLTAPEQAEREGNTVTVKYDTNGGIIGGGSNVGLIDMFNPNDYEADADGNVHIKVLDPVDSNRPNIGLSESNKNPLTKSGHILVGWYKTRIENSDGTYTYSDKWDFETDSFEVSKDATSATFTLYAMWTEYFEFDYYRVKTDGSMELIRKDELGVIPSDISGTEKAELAGVYLPDWNDGALVYKTSYSQTSGSYTFPKISGTTFTGAYLDKECTEEITTEFGKPFYHAGYIDEHGVAQNRVQNIYVTYDEGELYKISTAEQFAKYAYADGYFEISADLDFTNTAWPTSLTSSSFNGKIYGKDGKKVKISNVYAKFASDSSLVGGLFGELADGAVIKNVAFENVTVDIVKTGLGLTDLKLGVFAGNISSKAVIESVTLTGATLKLGGETNEPNGAYSVHMLANGDVGKITADYKTFGLEVYGTEFGDEFAYGFDPENVTVNDDGYVGLSFEKGYTLYEEKSYVIQERR